MENQEYLFFAVNNPKFLRLAIQRGSAHTVKYLLKYGAKVNWISKVGLGPLHTAALYNELEIAEILIQHGANVNANPDKSPLYFAVQNSNFKIVKLLLDNAAKANDPEILNVAVQENCIPIIKALLENGADINGYDERGKSAIFKASTYGYNDLIEFLVAAGGGLNFAEDGFSPLHEAVEREHFLTVKLLLKLGAKVNAPSNTGVTPLQIAAECGNEEIVEILLKFRADVNARDDDQNTALHKACERAQRGHITALHLLLLHGADVNIANSDNETPVERTIASWVACSYHLNEKLSFRNDCQCEKAVQLMIRHIVKLKMDNLRVSDDNLEAMGCSVTIIDYFLMCEQELSLMNSLKIPNTFVSFYDILSKSCRVVAKFLRNQDIAMVLLAKGYMKRAFTLYAEDLEVQVKMARQRLGFVGRCADALSLLFNTEELPAICTDKILDYLNNDDCRVLIEVEKADADDYRPTSFVPSRTVSEC